MTLKQRNFSRFLSQPIFFRFALNVIGHKRKQKILRITLCLIVCPVFAMLLLSGCAPSYNSPSQTELKPLISILEPATVDPNNAPIMFTIRGEGFRKGLEVNVTSGTVDTYSKNLKPVTVKSDELVVSLDNKFLESLAKVETPSNSLPDLVFRRVLTVKVVNPDGQKSNIKQVYLQRAAAQIKQVNVQDSLKILPGTRQEIIVSIERGEWSGDVPLHVISFGRDEIRSGTSYAAKRVSNIVGKTVIPAGASSAKLPIEVTSDTPPGKYRLLVLGQRTDKPFDAEFPSLSSAYLPTSAYEVVEIDVMDPSYQCYTCMPFAPEIAEFQRTSEGYIRILFKDNSSNEKGFRIKRADTADGVWKEIGNVEGNAAKFYGEYIDTTVELEQGYHYIVEAWNNAGVSQSVARYTKPPSQVPSMLQVYYRKYGFLLSWSWINNSETRIWSKPKTAILRKETIFPNSAWEVIKESCNSSFGSDQPCFFRTEGAEPIEQEDRSANRNVPYEYKIRVGDPNPETGLGTTYSEVVNAWFREGLTPAVPSDLSIIDNGDHLIRWKDNAVNEDGYLVYRSDARDPVGFKELVAELGAHSGTGWMEKQFSDYHPVLDTSVYYDVIATNLYGNSLISKSKHYREQLNTPEKPGTPYFSNVEARSLTVNWQDRSSDEAGFKMERNSSGSDKWIDMGNFDANTGTGEMEWENSGLLPSIQYCYRVTSFNDAGSSRSNEGCKTTLAAPGPELAFHTIRIEPTSLQAGPNTPFRLYYIVYNMGEVETGSFTDRLYFPNRNGQIETENVSVDSVAPFGSYLGQKSFPKGLPTGSYSFGVVLDINNNVSEKSEQPGYIWDSSETPYNPSNEGSVDANWQEAP